MSTLQKSVSYIQLIYLMLGILTPMLIWGVSVEKRIESNTLEIEGIGAQVKELKEEVKQGMRNNQESFDEIMDALFEIKLELKDKKDR